MRVIFSVPGGVRTVVASWFLTSAARLLHSVFITRVSMLH